MGHLVNKHGKMQCRGCGYVLGVLTAKEHFDEDGNCVKTRPQFAVGPVTGRNPTSGGRLNNYDVTTTRPLLAKDGNRSTVSGLPAFDEFSKGETNTKLMERNDGDTSTNNNIGGKVPTLPCPHCNKQCSYLKKHIRDVHQPKTSCPICGRRMGHSYLPEHMKIQHEGGEVPTRRCPLCHSVVQKLKNHLKATHKMNRTDADALYEKHYPLGADRLGGEKGTKAKLGWREKHRITSQQLTAEGLPIPETSITVEDRVLEFEY